VFFVLFLEMYFFSYSTHKNWKWMPNPAVFPLVVLLFGWGTDSRLCFSGWRLGSRVIWSSSVLPAAFLFRFDCCCWFDVIKSIVLSPLLPSVLLLFGWGTDSRLCFSAWRLGSHVVRSSYFLPDVFLFRFDCCRWFDVISYIVLPPLLPSVLLSGWGTDSPFVLLILAFGFPRGSI
jgi:hypothetical protein